MHPFQLPFSLLFWLFFETFRRKPKKGSRVRPQAHKNTSKWSSRAPKRSPRINNLRPKVPPSTNSRGRVLAEGDVDPPRCLQHLLPACWDPLLSILRLTCSRTDKVNSLRACTHLPFGKVTKTYVKPHVSLPNRCFTKFPEVSRPRRRRPFWTLPEHVFCDV